MNRLAVGLGFALILFSARSSPGAASPFFLSPPSPPQEASQTLPARVSVVVYDTRNHKPVWGAEVRVHGLDKKISKKTNRRGEVRLKVPLGGSQRVMIAASRRGYPSNFVSFNLSPGQQESFIIALRHPSRYSDPSISLRTLQAPGKARQAFRTGLWHLRSNKPKNSLKHFRRAIELYPDYDRAYLQLALGNLQLGRLSRARDTLEAALRVNEKNVGALILLGSVYSHMGRYDPAVAAFLRAAELAPANSGPHEALAKLFLMMGRHGTALHHASRAHTLDKGEEGTHMTLLGLLLLDHDLRAAGEEVEELSSLFPDSPFTEQARQWLAEARQQAAAQDDN